jgi:hypothetical protein
VPRDTLGHTSVLHLHAAIALVLRCGIGSLPHDHGACAQKPQRAKRVYYDAEPLDPPLPAPRAKREPATRPPGVEDCSGRDLVRIAGMPPCQDEAPAPGEENLTAKVRRMAAVQLRMWSLRLVSNNSCGPRTAWRAALHMSCAARALCKCSGVGHAASTAHPQVALMFLVNGAIPTEAIWTAFIASAAELTLRRSVPPARPGPPALFPELKPDRAQMQTKCWAHGGMVVPLTVSPRKRFKGAPTVHTASCT